MAIKSMQGVQHRYRHFGARVILPFDHTPLFPAYCIGCENLQPQLRWTPPKGMSPFTGQAQYFDNHNMLPAIEIPVCEDCIDQMPGRTKELSSFVASLFAPLLFASATLFFYTFQLYGVAFLTGVACLVWFVMASRAVWVVEHSRLFDVQVGKNDSLLYYFLDGDYAQEFNRLNSQTVSKESTPSE